MSLEGRVNAGDRGLQRVIGMDGAVDAGPPLWGAPDGRQGHLQKQPHKEQSGVLASPRASSTHGGSCRVVSATIRVAPDFQSPVPTVEQ